MKLSQTVTHTFIKITNNQTGNNPGYFNYNFYVDLRIRQCYIFQNNKVF